MCLKLRGGEGQQRFRHLIAYMHKCIYSTIFPISIYIVYYTLDASPKIIATFTRMPKSSVMLLDIKFSPLGQTDV